MQTQEKEYYNDQTCISIYRTPIFTPVLMVPLNGHFLVYYLCCSYKAKQGGAIGIVVSAKWFVPLTNTTADILAAKRALAFDLHWYEFFLSDNIHLVLLRHCGLITI
jgi:beta-glucosidase/6-phospho-beta-glucosidase/beta-galactosidase